jgi:spermidine synthase
VRQRGVVWQADGTESGVALVLDPTGYAFIVNGKSDGGARGDSGTQVMLGLVGALTAPSPRRALVIGLGTGSSAGWLGAMPMMEQVDVVELEPRILEVAHACQTVNHDVMNNPKVHLTIGDAREFLLTSKDRYDVIASEPSNPYRAGVASLFTLEYYLAAAGRLTDDGVFVQWVQGYEIDGRTLATLYATMSAVFPQVETWQTQRSDLLLVGSRKPHPHSVKTLAARIAEEPFRSALADSWRAVDVSGVLAHYLANDRLARAFAKGPLVEVNTDDRNVIEFGLARSVGRSESSVVADVRQLGRALNVARPLVDDPSAIDWQKVDTAWIAFNTALGFSGELRVFGTATEQARQLAMLRYYGSGDVEGARRAWSQAAEPPRDPSELMMMGDVQADAGSEAALPLIDRLRAYQPGEADVLLAKLRIRQSRTAEAASALESAFTRFRDDPWAAPQMKQLALELVAEVTAHDSSLARRMFDALGQPFAVHALDDARLITRAELSVHVDAESCRAAIGALEPHVPWTADFLVRRHDCYQRAGDPRLSVAIGDLAQFAASQGRQLSTFVPALMH